MRFRYEFRRVCITDKINRKIGTRKSSAGGIFSLVTAKKNEFSIHDVTTWFETLHLAKPNTSRLQGNIIKSSCFIRGNSKSLFKLHAREVNKLNEEFPQLKTSEEVISLDSVLPESLYQVSRGYIESLGKQINSSYEHNIFDGCAVLMRRFLEILLIQAYEKLGIEISIRDSAGNYMLLEGIVQDAISNSRLGLTRNSRSCLDKFRILGNFSAHKIYYICKKQYIEEVILEYRACIEELLYKSGLKI
jgi:hypothetical protein